MWRWYSLVSSLLLLFVLFSLLVVQEERRSRRLNVIVLTVDGLVVLPDEHGALSGWQAAREEAGAKQFHHYRTMYGSGESYMVRLLSGQVNPGITAGAWRSIDEKKWPLQRLSAHGYAVEGLQGFMTGGVYQQLGLRVDDPGGDVRYWLAKKKKENKPFLLWHHYAVKQLPAKDSAADISKDKLQEFDRWFTQFYRFLHKSGLMRNSVLVVTGWPGSGCAERGRGGFREGWCDVVPLIIWLPESVQADFPADPKRPCAAIDLMPTIMALLGVETVQQLPGRDLFDAETPARLFWQNSGGPLSSWHRGLESLWID